MTLCGETINSNRGIDMNFLIAQTGPLRLAGGLLSETKS